MSSNNTVESSQNVFSKVSGFLKSPWTILYVLLSLAIFISLGYYVYYYYVQPQIKPSYVENNELVKEEKENTAYLHLFSTEWCPHCKELMKPDGVWDKITKNSDLKKINNYNIVFIPINGDDEKRVDEFETQYKVKIDGFPSIYLVKDDQVIEFDANPTENSLIQFLDTVI